METRKSPAPLANLTRSINAMGKTDLQLGDALQQLGDGGGDVGQLDDVPLGGLGELAQRSQLVRDPLLGRQPLGKVGNQPTSHRDVSLFNLTYNIGTIQFEQVRKLRWSVAFVILENCDSHSLWRGHTLCFTLEYPKFSVVTLEENAMSI